jgi:hypothetical protein
MEAELPKRVIMKVSMRDYKKLIQISILAEQLKSDKEFRKVTKEIITHDGIQISVDSFIGMLIRLPEYESNISKPSVKRNAPKTMYFTDAAPSTKAVETLYKSTKLEDLRHDQSNYTCPADVRSMFYAYVRSSNLVQDGNIIIDKFLTKLAPHTLKNVTSVQRKDSSFIWRICSEIRGVEHKKKSKTKVTEVKARDKKKSKTKVKE